MGRRKAVAGGGHAAVLSAGAGWEARRAAGLGVRPETAAEATGRPPGKSLGAFRRRSIHWRLSRLDGAESDSLFTKDAAGWEQPFTHTSQTTVDWRRTWRALEARQAGSSHGEDAAKARWTGERRGKHTRHSALGCSIHWRLSTHRGLESGVALAGGVAGWELPCTNNGQSGVVRGRGPGCGNPTLPLFNYPPNLIPPQTFLR
jgi:hypothetical protein